MAEGVEGAVGHRRAEVGAADADVDHGAASACPSPRATSPLRTRSAKALIRAEHLVDVGHDVRDRRRRRRWPEHRAGRGAQRDVQHRAVLGDVDRLAGEHRVAAGGHARRAGDRDAAPPARRRRRAAWSSRCAGRRPRRRSGERPTGIVGEQRAQVRRPGDALQGGPCGCARDVDGGDRIHAADASHRRPRRFWGAKSSARRSILLVEIFDRLGGRRLTGGAGQGVALTATHMSVSSNGPNWVTNATSVASRP